MPDAGLLVSILSVIDRYGLPLFVLVALAFLVWKGILRLGSDVDKLITQADARTAYVEARRVEEREARLKAEERLASNSEALREATSAFQDANEIQNALMKQLEARK